MFDLNTFNFDPFAKDKKTQTVVNDLQSSILKSHGRERAILYFLQFNKGKIEDVKTTISTFAPCITPFRLQVEEAKQFSDFRIPGGTVVNFLLTAKGYLALNIEKTEKELREKFTDDFFINGMGSDYVRSELNDPEPAKYWEEAYLEKMDIKDGNKSVPKEIHALLIIADDDKSNLGQQVRKFLRDIIEIQKGSDLVKIVAAEHAILQRNAYGQVIEHFGFRDGISNPVFLKGDDEAILKNGGHSNWDPRAPLGLVLVKDPYGGNGDLSFGSYFVYRKYEQHVKTFETVIRNLSSDLFTHPDSDNALEITRALVMGRFRDGVPLVVKNEGRRYFNENYNNFNYEDDSNGSKCPFHAHIRKANPRGPGDMDHQIVRRGMTYGERTNYNPSELSSLPDNGVGLLFMSFQASLVTQFVHMQKEWANNPNFPKVGTGMDTIIGQKKEREDGRQINEPKGWPLEWNTFKNKYSTAMSSCVSLRGGEFFFAPSISFFENLKTKHPKP